MSNERRNFERVNIPETAGVYVSSSQGKRVGNVVMLGRGGLMLLTEHKYDKGHSGNFILVDDVSGIRTPFRATVRYKHGDGVGFEFDKLSSDAAVEVGVVIGKHYTKAAGK